MSSKWPGFVTDRPTLWTPDSDKQPPDSTVLTGTQTALSKLDSGYGENTWTGGKSPISIMSGFGSPDRDQRDQKVQVRSGRRLAPPPLPLHERKPSESNRDAGIRIVPYSPPRLESQQAAHNGPTHEAVPVAGSPGSSPRRRRQRRRRRRSKDRDNSNDEDGANDSDETATTVTSINKGNSRPTSWASRGSWGPSAAAAAIAAASRPGSTGSSRTGTSRTAVGGKPEKTRSSVLAEKSRNLVLGGNWTNAARSRKDGKLDKDKEGYASSGPGSALSTPAEAEFPLARGSTRGVSGSKLTSPTGSLSTIATTTATTTSDTLPDSANDAQSKTGNINISDVNATSRLLAHRQHQHQLPQPHQGDYDSHDASSHLPSYRFGLPPASVSFTAAAQSYLAEHNSLTDAPQLSSLPSSPLSSSTYFPTSSYQPPTITTSTAASTTLSAHSLSPSPSTASLTSVASSQAAPRPNSRRRNIIAVHSDKTFSLVPRAKGGFSRSSASSPTAGIFVHPDQQLPTSATTSSLKSPPLSFVTSTVRSSGSHERRSSGAFSSDDRPSSPLTSATFQDGSSLSPYSPSSAGSSTVHLFEDPIAPGDAFESSLPPSSNAASHTTSPWNYRIAGGLRAVPKTPDAKRKGKERAVPSTTASAYSRSHSLYAQKHHQVVSGLDISVLPPLSEISSPSTNIVAGGAPAVATSHSPKKKTSFASETSAGALSTASSFSFSASTISAATNYKVYAHSPSPAPAFESSESLGLLSTPSATTNVEILGVSSPAAPPLPVLRRNEDPDQTFGSLTSYPSVASFDTGISNASSAPNFVVLGASSPPAPSRYLERYRSSSTGNSIGNKTVDDDRDDSFAPDTDIPSSPPLPPRTANTTTDTLGTSDSEQNYVLHGEPSSIFIPPQSSSSGGSSLVTISRQPRPVYSQESLIVPPLKTVRAKRSNERFGYYKTRSRESLRRAASLKSISSIFNQEAASTFFAGQAFLNINIPPVPVVTPHKSSLKHQQQLPAFMTKAVLPKRKPLPILAAPTAQSENIVVYDRTPKKNTQRGPPDSWDSSSPPQLSSPSPSSSSASPSASPTLPQQPRRVVQMVEEHPHQWSSQLSTVMSESDDAESVDLRAVSRSVSVVSGAPSGAGSYIRSDVSALSVSGVSGVSGRRSSSGWVGSTHSRNLPSISSSLGLQMDELRDRNSRSDSLLLDRPNPAFFRANSASPASSSSAAPPPPPIRTVRDHDEHGDGLADLHDVMRQPSRTGLSGFFSSSNSSARNLHSSNSMRSIASGGVIPTWARVYYGSGEHRALSAAPSMSDLGHGDDEYMGGAQPNSAYRRSPSVDNMALNIFNTRRTRPRQVQPGGTRMEAGDAGAMQQDDEYRIQRPPGLRKMTSSLWSPHLRVDRRATRFSVWEPPTVEWSYTSATFDRRNFQVILFTVGFIFPFAWMIASFLPLPLDSRRAMEKRAEGDFGVPAALKRRVAQADEMRFQSARWWRTLNRVMSVFGLLILGAVVALVVIGIRQGWGK